MLKGSDIRRKKWICLRMGKTARPGFVGQAEIV